MVSISLKSLFYNKKFEFNLQTNSEGEINLLNLEGITHLSVSATIDKVSANRTWDILNESINYNYPEYITILENEPIQLAYPVKYYNN